MAKATKTKKKSFKGRGAKIAASRKRNERARLKALEASLQDSEKKNNLAGAVGALSVVLPEIQSRIEDAMAAGCDRDVDCLSKLHAWVDRRMEQVLQQVKALTESSASSAAGSE
jgi:hypothetical protein